MDLSLKNKVALVTGGARGLGRAICLGFAGEGARVVVNSVRSDPTVLARELRKRFRVKALGVRADVSKSEEVRALFDGIESELGPVDILINNAGATAKSLVRDTSDAEWDVMLALNLTGSFLTCREAVRRWLAAGRGGRIVNITSTVASQGSTTGRAHYAAAKAGLANFTISLAREMAPHGIYVNSVAPGFMETEMVEEALRKNREQYLERIPLRRVAAPAEMVPAVLLLASERASYMTGTTIHVNGGMWMT